MRVPKTRSNFPGFNLEEEMNSQSRHARNESGRSMWSKNKTPKNKTPKSSTRSFERSASRARWG
jgi:hypothetical protein